MTSSAPSSSSWARPETLTARKGSFWSTMLTDTRGSARRFFSLARPTAVLKMTSSPSTSTHTTVLCRDPSERSVVAQPGKASASSAFAASFSPDMVGSPSVATAWHEAISQRDGTECVGRSFPAERPDPRVADLLRVAGQRPRSLDDRLGAERRVLGRHPQGVPEGRGRRGDAQFERVEADAHAAYAEPVLPAAHHGGQRGRQRVVGARALPADGGEHVGAALGRHEPEGPSGELGGALVRDEAGIFPGPGGRGR